MNPTTRSPRLTAASLSLLVACGQQSAQTEAAARSWPPDLAPPAQSNDSAGGGDEFFVSGYTFVYEDRALSRRTDVWGMTIADGWLEVPGNIFELDAISGLGYADASYEVVRADATRTLLRLDEDEGDRILILQPHGPPGSPSDREQLEPFLGGTRVRCGDRTFELRRDGWYERGALVHAFAAEVAPQAHVATPPAVPDLAFTLSADGRNGLEGTWHTLEEAERAIERAAGARSRREVPAEGDFPALLHQEDPFDTSRNDVLGRTRDG